MSRFFLGRTSNTPPVVKNLIIINAVMWVGLIAFLQFSDSRIYLNSLLGLYPIHSPYFYPFQIVTHMFMHSERIFHLLFNMWALWIFGKTLESVWGSKRFLIYYLATGLGAAFFHMLVNYIQFAPEIAFLKEAAMGPIDIETLQRVQPGSQLYAAVRSLSIPTVGASGAVYGVLLAFGVLFPNTPLFIIPFPFPIKAKWLVIGFGVLELYLGISQTGDSIAHFAHLGGMIFGFILIKYWNKFTRNFY